MQSTILGSSSTVDSRREIVPLSNTTTTPTNQPNHQTLVEPSCVQKVLDESQLSKNSSSASKLTERKICWLSAAEGLPIELWYMILSHLTKPEDLKNVSLVCEELYQLSRDKAFWNSNDKLFGNLKDLGEYKLENQLLLSQETKLKNAERMIIESIKAESKVPRLETLLKFLSVRQWILTELPHLVSGDPATPIQDQAKDLKNSILNALHPILLSTSNPWRWFFTYQPSNSKTIEEEVLSYLKKVLEELQMKLSDKSLDLDTLNKIVFLGVSLSFILEDSAKRFISNYVAMESPLFGRNKLQFGQFLNRMGEYLIEGRNLLVLSFLQHLPKLSLKVKDRVWLLEDAIKEGHLALVGALIKKPKYLKLKNLGGDSALWMAVYHKKLKIVKFLLEKGASIKEKAQLATLALKNNDLATFRLLIQKGDKILNERVVETSPENKTTFLHLAIEKGFLEIVEYLCQIGADLSKEEDGGKGALLLATKKGDKKLVNDILIKLPNNKELDHSLGIVALPNKTTPANEPVNQSLIDRSCIQKALDESPLSENSFLLETPTKRKILDQMGTALSKEDNGRKEDLLLAIRKGDKKLVEGILIKLANNKELDLIKREALDLAIKETHLEIASLLIQEGAMFSPESAKLVVKKRYSEVLTEFIKKHGVDYEDVYGTLLLVAIEEGKSETVMFLKSQGANLNLKSKKKRLKDFYFISTTPLLQAIKKGKLSLVKWLIKEGANVDRIALKYAKETNLNGCKDEIIKFLEDTIKQKSIKPN